MRYFVPFSELKNISSKEDFRQLMYKETIRFLTRKQIQGNPIVAELNRFKAYFESRPFVLVYFLSPFVLRESVFADDMIRVILSSGNTNTFDSVYRKVLEEVQCIENGLFHPFREKIHVKDADGYISLYRENPHFLPDLVLDSGKEKEILTTVLKDAYSRKEKDLSVLYAGYLSLNAKGMKEQNEALSVGQDVLSFYPESSLTDLYLAYTYLNIGNMLQDSREKAYFYLHEGGEKSEPNCLYLEGILLYRGEGVRKNPNQALSVWKKAVELGSEEALSCVGIYYLANGKKEEARKYFLLAAEKGDYKGTLLLDTEFKGGRI